MAFKLAKKDLPRIPMKLIWRDISKNGRVIIILLASSTINSVKSIVPRGQVIESLKAIYSSPSNGDMCARSRPIDPSASL